MSLACVTQSCMYQRLFVVVGVWFGIFASATPPSGLHPPSLSHDNHAPLRFFWAADLD